MHSHTFDKHPPGRVQQKYHVIFILIVTYLGGDAWFFMKRYLCKTFLRSVDNECVCDGVTGTGMNRKKKNYLKNVYESLYDKCMQNHIKRIQLIFSTIPLLVLYETKLLQYLKKHLANFVS